MKKGEERIRTCGIPSEGTTNTYWDSQKEKRQEQKIIWGNIAWKLPSFMTDMNLQIQQAQQTPNRLSLKRPNHGTSFVKRQNL